MNRKSIAIVTASVLALGWLAWAAWPEPQGVETAPLERGDFVRELVEDARTRVRDRYTVTAPLAGQLVRPVLKAGDTVSAGQVVAEIRPAAATLLDARSQGEQRERVAAMQATLVRAQANLARARVAEQQARADLARAQSLGQQGFVSPTQQESAQRTLQQRYEELGMAEQEVNAQALLTHVGQPVLAEDGDPLGLFLGLGRHADVPTPFALVRGRDEAVRYFRATVLSVGEDGLLLTSITAYQFRRLPELPPQR